MTDFLNYRLQDFKLMQKYYPDSSFFKKVLYCWKKYHYQKKYNFAHMEFFCFHLAEKSKSEVQQFYPRKHQAKLYNEVNSKFAWAVTKDKFASYLMFKPFYKRAVCAYNPMPSPLVAHLYDGYEWEKNVISFLNNNFNFIVKPLSEACGRGIKIIRRDTIDSSKELMKTLVEEYAGGFILEEIICQHEALSKFHPSSVNTIRVNTFNSACCVLGGVDAKFAVLRVGRRGSVVDNAGGGGLFVALDENSGQILHTASNEDFFTYKEHPDTHVPFEGQIPCWNQLLSTCTEVASVMPELRIAGLDFALDKDKGWVLVEVNCEPHILYEIATEKGVRSYMEDFERKVSNNISK